MLPYGLEFNLPAVGEIIGELLLALGGPEKFVATPAGERPQEAIAILQNIQNELYATTQLPRTLSEAGVNKALFDDIAQKAIHLASFDLEITGTFDTPFGTFDKREGKIDFFAPVPNL